MPTTSHPQVSIGLPVHNGQAFVGDTLRSLLAQTFTDFELLISDNGSRDETWEICAEFAGGDSRIRLYRSEQNRGVAWNYRNVLEHARGQYFRWASADDLFAAESLACCVEVLEQRPDAVLCYPKTTLIDKAGNTLGQYEDNLNLQDEDPCSRYRQVIRRLGLVNIIYGLMRTEVVRRTGLIGSYPGADEAFVSELALHGKFVEIDRPLFFRRMHDQASSGLQSGEEVQVYLNPASEGKVVPRTWYCQRDRLASVMRAPLPLRDRMQLIGFLLREMLIGRRQYGKELRALINVHLRRWA
jgi:glycosyltransferase involved in cell wall biosynthesis